MLFFVIIQKSYTTVLFFNQSHPIASIQVLQGGEDL